MRPPKTPVICSTKHGFDMIVQPGIDNGVERSIYLSGTYEEGTLAVLSRMLRLGDIVIDVGANIGLMTLHAARLVGQDGRIFSLEPMPDIFRQLHLNIALNNATQVQIYPLALGSRQGVLPIYAHPEINRGSGSLVCYGEGVPAGNVEVMQLDEFVARNVRRPIRLIKIDVEGWELEVLQGAKSTLSTPDAPALCVECSNAHPLQGGTPVDLYEFITRINNYRCFALERGKERPSKLVPILAPEHLPAHDNLFCFLPREPIPDLDTGVR